MEAVLKIKRLITTAVGRADIADHTGLWFCHAYSMANPNAPHCHARTNSHCHACTNPNLSH